MMMQMKESRIPQLDGVRGLAIFMVLATHLLKFEGQSVASGICAGIAQAGWVGVDLFFVLSGFLITGILVKTREDPHFFKNFYARRALRIFPLYFGYLAIYQLFVIHWGWVKLDASRVLEASHEMPWLWAYASNVLIALKGNFITASLNHFWTLAIEEQLYLIWPAVIFYCPPQRLRGFCVLGIIAVIVGRVVALQLWNPPFAIHVLTPFRADSFFVGAYFALNGQKDLHFLQRHISKVLGVLLIGLLLGVWIRGGLFWSDAWIQTFGYTAIAIVFGWMLTMSLEGTLFRSSALRFLGRYSYAIYVFHHPLNIAFERLWPTSLVVQWVHSWFLGALLHASIVTSISIGFALLSWNLFEVHFMNLKKYFIHHEK